MDKKKIFFGLIILSIVAFVIFAYLYHKKSPRVRKCLQCSSGEFMQHEHLVLEMEIRRKMWYIDEWGGYNCLNGHRESVNRDILIPTVPCKTVCVTVTVEKETEKGRILNGVAKDCADHFFISGKIEEFPSNTFYLFRDLVRKEYEQNDYGNFTYTYEFLKDNFHNTDEVFENYEFHHQIMYMERSYMPQYLAVGFLIIVVTIILSIIGTCFLSRCMTRRLRREIAQLRGASGHLDTERANELVLVEQAEDIPLAVIGQFDDNEENTQ